MEMQIPFPYGSRFVPVDFPFDMIFSCIYQKLLTIETEIVRHSKSESRRTLWQENPPNLKTCKKMFEYSTNESVSDHIEWIRSIQIDKYFITQTFRMYNFNNNNNNHQYSTISSG